MKSEYCEDQDIRKDRDGSKISNFTHTSSTSTTDAASILMTHLTSAININSYNPSHTDTIEILDPNTVVKPIDPGDAVVRNIIHNILSRIDETTDDDSSLSKHHRAHNKLVKTIIPLGTPWKERIASNINEKEGDEGGDTQSLRYDFVSHCGGGSGR